MAQEIACLGKRDEQDAIEKTLGGLNGLIETDRSFALDLADEGRAILGVKVVKLVANRLLTAAGFRE